MLPFILIVCIFSACELDMREDRKKPKVYDSLNLKVNYTGKFTTNYLNCFNINGNIWITLLNPRKFRIHVFTYDAKAKRIINKTLVEIPHQKIGKDKILSYYFLNPDSLFVLPDNPEEKKLYLINKDGQLVKEWEFKYPLDNGNSNYQLRALKLRKTGNYLFGRLNSYKDNAQSQNDIDQISNLYNFPSHFKLNLNDSGAMKNLRNPFAHWPEYVKSKEKVYFERPKFVVNKKSRQIAFFYNKRPLIHLYDIESGKLIAKKNYGFKGYRKGLPIKKDGPQGVRESHLKSSNFSSARSDLALPRYYVLYEHPLENNNQENQINVSSDKKKEILVFNDSFNLEQRLRLKDNRQYYSQVYRAKEGFFMLKRQHHEAFSLVYFKH